MKEYGHVVRVLVVVIALFALWIAAQLFLRPADYGELGTIQHGSLQVMLAQEPVHLGKQACADCHSDIFDTHEKDLHFDVQCEDCHGPGNRHIDYFMDDDESLTEADAAMPKEYTLEGCLFCHRRLASRPVAFPQIDKNEHYRFLHVQDEQTRCIECHSPHEPIFLLTRFDQARVHPVIFECDHCHPRPMDKSHKDVPDHPVIFVCEDCHAPVVADFESRTHHFMRCTACHLFHQENEVAGRIFKNGNRRFCLLCHEEKPFRDPQAVPQIVSAEHIVDMADMMDEDGASLARDPRACLNCHFDMIHHQEILEEGGKIRAQN
jgi:hypothetical protein